jgi:hypothetical protein
MISASGCAAKDSSGEVIDAGAGGIELSEQGDGLTAHGLLDLRGLAHLRGAQCVTPKTSRQHVGRTGPSDATSSPQAYRAV